MSNTKDITVDEALRVLRADYYSDIRGLALEARQAMAEGLINQHLGRGRELDLSDWLHEAIDGHHRVIYTLQAKIGLLCSDNEDAYQEEMGEPAPSVEAQCYFAMRADVMEHLDSDCEPGGCYVVRDSGGENFAADTIDGALELAMVDETCSVVGIGWSPEEDPGAARLAVAFMFDHRGAS